MSYLTGSNVIEYLANTPQITFEVTERCNLSCVYCGYGKLYSNKGIRNGRNLALCKATTFLSYIRELWESGYNTQGCSNLIISFYGGEPLLNMSLIKRIIDYIETNMCGYGKTFIYSMTTNAILLPRYMDYLVSKKFRLLISLDGDENGSSLRVFPNGQSAFKNISYAVDLFRDRYPDYFRSKVEFNSVLSSRTSVKEIIQYINDKYHKLPTISEINTDGVNPKEAVLFESIYLNKLESANELNSETNGQRFVDNPQFDRIARYILMHSPYAYMDYNELLFDLQKERKKIPTGTCLPFTKKVFVTVTGKIMPCERIGYKYSLGIIDDGRIDIDFAAIAQMYNEYFGKVKNTCSHCFNRDGCLCCILNNGQLNSPSAKCRYFVTFKDSKLREVEVANFLKRYPEAYAYIMTQYEVI